MRCPTVSIIDTYSNYILSKIPVYPIQKSIDIFNTQWEISLPSLIKNVFTLPMGPKI